MPLLASSKLKPNLPQSFFIPESFKHEYVLGLRVIPKNGPKIGHTPQKSKVNDLMIICHNDVLGPWKENPDPEGNQISHSGRQVGRGVLKRGKINFT